MKEPCVPLSFPCQEIAAGQIFALIFLFIERAAYFSLGRILPVCVEERRGKSLLCILKTQLRLPIVGLNVSEWLDPLKSGGLGVTLEGAYPRSSV